MIDITSLVIEDSDPMLPVRRDAPAVTAYRCPGCGDRFTSPRPKAYCSSRCRAGARAVRYGRRLLARYGAACVKGLPYTEERDTLHTKLWAFHMGYDDRARRLPKRAREAVWQRDGGRCAECGAPGEEIDHIADASPDRENLRLLCMRCHDGRSLPRLLGRVAGESLPTGAKDLVIRIEAPTPRRPCDDLAWGTQWQAWVEDHSIREC